MNSFCGHLLSSNVHKIKLILYFLIFYFSQIHLVFWPFLMKNVGCQRPLTPLLLKNFTKNKMAMSNSKNQNCSKVRLLRHTPPTLNSLLRPKLYLSVGGERVTCLRKMLRCDGNNPSKEKPILLLLTMPARSNTKLIHG